MSNQDLYVLDKPLLVAAEKRVLGLYLAALLLLLHHRVALPAVVVVAAVTFIGRNRVTLAPIIKDQAVPVDSIV